MPVLNSFLFSEKALPNLEASQVDNQALLTAIRSLAFTVEGRSLRGVDYKNLGPEELGSVYESLLELHPILNIEAGTFHLMEVAGSDRKKTGSYYTPTSLIQVLLDSALDPVIEQALAEADHRPPTADRGLLSAVSGQLAQEQALLNLKVCDPACGSGHFLIAAAHRIARRLAQIQAGGDEPPPTALRQALRAVIARCIYGVDVNPMAVELCKVNLWLESIEPGKPLSFLDAHIKCGNSLVGVGPGMDISEIPDEAFKPVTGDDKLVAAAVRRNNKAERTGQLSFSLVFDSRTEDIHGHFARQARALESLPEDTVEQIQSKANSYFSLLATREYRQKKLENDLWTSAFFWKLKKENEQVAWIAPTQAELQKVRAGKQISGKLEQEIRQMAEELRFFHWELEFPEVFNAQAGMEQIKVVRPLKARTAAAEPAPMPVKAYVSPELVEKVRQLARQVKDADELVWQALKDRQLMNAHFERRAQVAGEQVEFYCAQAQLLVSVVTGDVDKRTIDQREALLKKLKKAGLRVVTLWGTSFGRYPEVELEKIATALAEAAWRPRSAEAAHSTEMFAEAENDEVLLPEMPPRLPGFDCVLGNPPWERIKLQEEEFFAQRDPEIASAPNKAARQKLINQLTKANPSLAIALEEAKHSAEALSKFTRESERYPLTSVGDINTYTLFSEMARVLLNPQGRIGIIVPTGIATDNTTKDFISDVITTRTLVAFYGMDNEAMIFSGIDHRNKFGLLCLGGIKTNMGSPVFTFSCSKIEDIKNPIRRFTLTADDLYLFNPNTRTLPVFKTKTDAELSKKIFGKTPILINENTTQNPWSVRFIAMFHMSNDSYLFQTRFMSGYVPLYEAKMMHQFDHRFATYEGATKANLSEGSLPQPSLQQKQDFNYQVLPQYWVSKDEVEKKLVDWPFNWLVGFREIANNSVERTMIFSVLPRVAIGNKIPLIFPFPNDVRLVACFLGCANSLTFDYVSRQKVAGTTLNLFIVKQLPFLSPSVYTPADIDFIAPRVIELVYTANDLKSFAADLGYTGGPFRWNEEHRTLLRAELDAYYAKLYGLTRDELRYILDPQDVYGPDFPGETFRVLKEKEIRQYGEYRTRRLVLEAWDRLEANGELPMASGGGSVSEPAREVITIQPEKKVEEPAPPPKAATPPVLKEQAEGEKSVQPSTMQASFTDFGLYKCESCGKMVMGFEKESHASEVHSGKKVLWKKLR